MTNDNAWRLRNSAPSLALISLAALLLAACSGPQAPPPQYYQLRLESPGRPDRVDGAGKPSPDDASGIWQLMTPVRLPEYLERDVLWLPVGESGLQPLPGHRWAEPLDEAVPRILLHDLAQLHGAGRVWTGSLPSGVTAGSQLRVQILELGVSPDRRSVHLRARCAVSDRQGTKPPRVLDIDVSAPSASAEPDALVAAHRSALWEMARKIVEQIGA